MLISQQCAGVIGFVFGFRYTYKNDWSRLWSFMLCLDLFYATFCRTPREAEQRPALFCFRVNTPGPTYPKEQVRVYPETARKAFLLPSSTCLAVRFAWSWETQIPNPTLQHISNSLSSHAGCKTPSRATLGIVLLYNPPQNGEISVPWGSFLPQMWP